MIKKYLTISVLVILGGIASGALLGLKANEHKQSSAPPTPQGGTLPAQGAINFSKIKNCYPSDVPEAPLSVKKLEYEGQVLYQVYDMYFEVNQFGVCKKLDIAGHPANLSEHISKDFAVDIKKRYWKDALKGLSPEGLDELLNSPYTYSPHQPGHPLFPEDVEALKQLGQTVGPKASVFKNLEAYLKADPYLPIVQEGSRKADEIIEKRRRQKHQQP